MKKFNDLCERRNRIRQCTTSDLEEARYIERDGVNQFYGSKAKEKLQEAGSKIS